MNEHSVEHCNTSVYWTLLSVCKFLLVLEVMREKQLKEGLNKKGNSQIIIGNSVPHGNCLGHMAKVKKLSAAAAFWHDDDGDVLY